ncbi:MAG: hypothetical protein ABIT05_05125 [Chitinophagaceae bacterium]
MRNCNYLIVFFIFFASCSKGLSGKIEKRNKNDIYLVNTSSSKIFRFTIKETKIINDSIYEYSTGNISLSPGDEKRIGVESGISELQYRMIDVKSLHVYIKVPDSLKDVESYKIFFNIGGYPMFRDSTIDCLSVKFYHYKDPLNILEIQGLRDTMVGGLTGKYKFVTTTEKAKLPSSPDLFKYIYKVTGQVEIDPKDWRK